MKKKLKKKNTRAAPARQAYTRYAGAERSRLTADWLTAATSANADIRRDLPLLRERARDLCGNNEFAKRFVSLLDQNVIGPKGIKLQAAVTLADETNDEQANIEIERAFEEWSRPGQCDVTGGLSFVDCCDLALHTAAVDGESFTRLVRGYPNDHGFALEMIDTDRIEERHAQSLPEGEILMGIELDSWRRPRAYHVLSRHPSEGYAIKAERARIPSAEMVHLFRRDRVGQVRGLPWMHAIMSRLRVLGAYEEAELLAARVGACKMGFYKKTEMSEMPIIEPKKKEGERQASEEPEDKGRLVHEAAPATFEELPYGYDFQSFTPDHPAGNYGSFIKVGLRSVASGLNVSYSSLSNDLESLNYSSIRAGLLDERDYWRKCQRWFVHSFVQPIYESWLMQAYLGGVIDITPEQYLLAGIPVWQPRGWAWVDPLKDEQAATEALANGLTTRTKILAEKGEDFEDTMKQLAAEQKIAGFYGVECGTGRKVPEREPENPEREELRLVKSA
ncbi:MAG: phage portal protein [Chromatiales bacterium]